FDPLAAGDLTFEPVNPALFPAYELGRQAGMAGGTAPAVFNAANEVAVELVLNGTIRFGRIAGVIDGTLARASQGDARTLEGVLTADGEARRLAREIACS
ncbi:MAG TPA: 1-deoxy-D-xylulose-5-phosphate reductoisomerase, partial [Gemmatimonadales bacterium]|nr:1-deoxy-D-xylulose-5-phosphate reductoisomerase [Gemmatimonadales bacterium]